jgi:hypothetical protein
MDTELHRRFEELHRQLARILDRLGSLERDFTNTKDFLVTDAQVGSRRWLDLEARITALEGRK